MDQDLLVKALKAVEHGKRYAFATVVETTKKGTPRKSGAKMIVYEDGTSFGSIGGGRNEKAAQKECLKAIKACQTALVTYDYFGHKGQSVCGGQMKVFIEPFSGPKNLIICGAGHIALPLSVQAKLLGYHVTIIDNRKEFANKKRFPHVDRIIVGKHDRELGKIPINLNTHIMIVTQGNEYDYQCLKRVVRRECGYLGVISSRPKRVKFLARLRKMRVSETHIKKIHIPVGIDIGAQTPEEIAVSIAAEWVALNNQNYVGTDKFTKK